MATDGKAFQPAFPVPVSAHTTGLTKREFFAAMALQGLLAASVPRPAAVEFAVMSADSLIEALEAAKS